MRSRYLRMYVRDSFGRRSRRAMLGYDAPRPRLEVRRFGAYALVQECETLQATFDECGRMDSSCPEGWV